MPSPYTSARSGEFNAATIDTWGQGVGVFPSLAADVFTVANGHTVTVTNVNTHELGDSTVAAGGILKFSRTANGKLTFGQNILTVNGTLDMGQVGDYVGVAYLAELYWNPTNDTKGLVIGTDGKLYTADNPAFYGSEWEASLNANWTSGQTFTIVGDYTTKWIAGQKVVVHKCSSTGYSSYITDCQQYTIASVIANGANSDVMISEAAPGLTFVAGALVLNVSRNVRLGKLNYTAIFGNNNTLRPKLTVPATISVGDIVMGGEWVGWYLINSLYGVTYQNSWVARNGSYPVYNANYTTINGIIMSMTDGLYLVYNSIINAYLLTNLYVGTASYNCILNGEIYANSVAFRSTVIINGNLYGNNQGIQPTFPGTAIITGKIGWNKNNISCKNSSDLLWHYPANGILINAKLPNAGLVLNGRNTPPFTGNWRSEHHNQILNAHYKYDAYADVIKNTGTKRTDGAASSIEVVPQSNCSTIYTVQVLGSWEEDAVQASSQTRTIYIKGEGWSTFPTNVQLYIEAEYLNHLTLMTTTTAVSTAVLTDNTTWTAFPVTFTPLQVGIVRYKVYLKIYGAACKVYIDNAIYNGVVMAEAKWSEGESYLLINQDAWAAAGGGLLVHPGYKGGYR